MAIITASVAVPKPPAVAIAASVGVFTSATWRGMKFFGVKVPLVSGGSGVPGYTVRTGDTLLVVDMAGKMTGILPS